MRISDWSSDVCSSDLSLPHGADLRVRLAHSAGQLREALRPQYSLPFPIAPEVPADEDGIGRARCLERSGVGAAERRCRSGADESGTAGPGAPIDAGFDLNTLPTKGVLSFKIGRAHV